METEERERTSNQPSHCDALTGSRIGLSEATTLSSQSPGRPCGSAGADVGGVHGPSGLGAVAVGFDFGYEAPITDQGKASWLGFRVGGGIGAAVVTGRIDQWHNGRNLSADPTNNCLPDARQLDRYEACDPDETLELWPVLPILDLDLGLRIHAGESAIIRIDGGFHDMFYGGVAAGAVF